MSGGCQWPCRPCVCGEDHEHVLTEEAHEVTSGFLRPHHMGACIRSDCPCAGYEERAETDADEIADAERHGLTLDAYRTERGRLYSAD